MKPNLAVVVRVFIGWAVLAILPLPVPLYGAQAGFPFAEDFQSQSFLDSTQTTARWTSSGVTLGHARGRHVLSLGRNAQESRVGNSSAKTNINDIAFRDMDGDGRLDIVTATDDGVFVYFIRGVGGLETLQPTKITVGVAAFETMAFGDFDRDGDLDIAVAGDRNTVTFYQNNGGGDFEEHSGVSELRTIAMEAADMDGDGDLDLVLAKRKGKGVRVYLNNGEGVFDMKEDAVSSSSGDNKGLDVGDLDGDGDMDIVLAKKKNTNVFYLNDGTGAFDDAQPLDHTEVNRPHKGVALGDVDSDGDLDVAYLTA